MTDYKTISVYDSQVDNYLDIINQGTVSWLRSSKPNSNPDNSGCD